MASMTAEERKQRKTDRAENIRAILAEPPLSPKKPKPRTPRRRASVLECDAWMIFYRGKPVGGVALLFHSIKEAKQRCAADEVVVPVTVSIRERGRGKS